MSAATLQSEIERKSTRRAELVRDRAGAASRLKAARAALVDGGAKASDVTAAQAEYTTLDEAISDLDGQLSQLNGQLQQAVAAERQAGQVGVVVKEMREAAAAAEAANAAIVELIEVAGPVLAKRRAALARLREARENAIAALGNLLGGRNLFVHLLSHGGGFLRREAESALQSIEKQSGVSAAPLRSGVGRQSVVDDPTKGGLEGGDLVAAIDRLAAAAEQKNERAA